MRARISLVPLNSWARGSGAASQQLKKLPGSVAKHSVLIQGRTGGPRAGGSGGLYQMDPSQLAGTQCCHAFLHTEALMVLLLCTVLRGTQTRVSPRRSQTRSMLQCRREEATPQGFQMQTPGDRKEHVSVLRGWPGWGKVRCPCPSPAGATGE